MAFETINIFSTLLKNGIADIKRVKTPAAEKVTAMFFNTEISVVNREIQNTIDNKKNKRLICTRGIGRRNLVLTRNVRSTIHKDAAVVD